MTLTMFCYLYHFTDYTISHDLLIIVAGIELPWNVVTGDVVSVKKIHVLFTIRDGGLYWEKLCMGSSIALNLSYEIRPFKT